MRIESENYERLQTLERLGGLNEISGKFRADISAERGIGGYGVNIERYSEDYQNIKLDGSGIVYCDIPYRNTECDSYEGFDHDRFYEWALRQTVPVYISEYSMPDDFVMIHGISKRQLSTSKGATNLVTEGIWVSRKVAEELKRKCNYQISIFDMGIERT